MIRITDIIDKIQSYDKDANIDTVNRAYIYSARVHEGQVRLSGEPYLSHPLEVAGILADMNLEVESIAAGLLHDVVEDTHTTVEEIEEMFGPEIGSIVSGVTKLGELSIHSSEERQAENIRKMILAMAADIRVILIKLADRLHNMRTLQHHKEENQLRIAQETLDIFAPIAGRLGIYWIRKELEDHSFMFLEPERYLEISRLIDRAREEREKYIETVKGLIKEKLAAAGIHGEVFGRHKHVYSIYGKMRHQNLAFEDVYDVIAFRIIVETVPKCYEVLGLVHSIWKPIPKKFKDYIGNPKPNMYQSLHTTVIGPHGARMEIQIRTYEMDNVAKSGIAAHWSYKEGRQTDEKTRQAISWIQNIVENQQNFKDPGEFLENVRIDLFPDEVYVFTPRGDVVALPRGATPVDFAYAIHSEVGHRCIGAKVNGRMVPLKTELRTGDSIEINTAKNHHPSKDWLSFVKTVKARSRIRQWIKTELYQRSLVLGREMCEKTFRRHRMNFSTFLHSDEIGKLLQEFGFKTLDDLLVAVGYGKLTPLQVLRRYASKGHADAKKEELSPKPVARDTRATRDTGILVKGVDDILIRFGKCCDPVPGDPITGYITRGHGVSVHRKACVNVLKLDPSRQIDVSWDETTIREYPVRLHIQSLDRVGLLAEMTTAISKCEANILHANTKVRDGYQVDCFFTITVPGRNHLDRVMKAISKVQSVQSVRRMDT
ncbi:RelA/SpoT family protein [Thermodesulfobacteriota bacterium]